ncbi:MAG: family 1 glycosylhydrolase [Vicinamibacteria bacterium]
MKKLLRAIGVLAVLLGVAWLGTCAWFALREPAAAFAAADLAKPPAPLPAGFLWGTASAAHQVEGGNANDWTRFEAQKGTIERGETSAVAAGGWERMSDDIALMKKVRANAYRFSIEWSRLEPTEGAWNEAAWERYAGFVKALRQDGITPMVTLLHFTLPQWMADRGGVASPDFPDRFARFAGEAGKRLGPDVELWVTLNEPNVQMYMGYVAGVWPPQVKSPQQAVKAYLGLLRAHAAAAKGAACSRPARGSAWRTTSCSSSRARGLSSPTGSAREARRRVVELGLRRRRPRRPRAAVAAGRRESNARRCPSSRGRPTSSASTTTRYFVRFAPGTTEGFAMTPGPGLVSEIGGSDPQGDSPPEALYLLMREAWRRYRQPIYVTEGGIADEKGTMRGALVRGQRHAIDRALAEGVPVKGYLHWTLLDNFEWDKGYRPKFGLFHVDPQTLERTPAGGSDVFAELAPR